MPATREDRLTPAWTRDRVDSNDPPEIEAAFFDQDLHAWVLSRYVDVMTAFRETSLLPGKRNISSIEIDTEENARLKMREEVRDALCPARVRAWREELLSKAESLSRQLPLGEPVDLIADYARPLCLDLAAMVTGISQDDAQILEEPAKIVSAATAQPEDSSLHARAEDANGTLRGRFGTGPESLRDSGFVGLSQTLLRIVSSAWYALVRFPDQWHMLRGSPQSIDQAMEELLRYAGIVRILWRTASSDICLNGAMIRKGDYVLLRAFAGAHDAERFDDAERLDCARRGTHHFVFGAGEHACVAASLIRMAAATITAPLISRFVSMQLAQSVAWQGGSVMRSPASLWVTLREG